MSGLLASFELVCFDAGGTLLRPFPSVGEIYHRIAKEHGLHVEPHRLEEKFFERWHKKDLSQLVSYSDEKVEKKWWRDLVEEIFSHFDPVKNFDVFFDHLYDHFAKPECWKLFPETVEVLETLKNRNKRLCVISNWDSRLMKLCRIFEIEKYFEFILISAVFGASKPNSRIFAEACNRANVMSEKVVHIGDSLEDDVMGAHRAGLKTIFIDRHGRKQGGVSDLSIYATISNLKEIL